MGDGIKVKYALVINPDTEDRHLGNVENSLGVLEQQGYETYVVSTEKPQSKHDHYAKSDFTELGAAIDEIRSKIDDDDEVLIYTTGHGSLDGEDPRICLDSRCQPNDAFDLLNFSEAGQRVIVMDQCFSGGMTQKFLAQPKTLFLSPGSQGEMVSCGEFAPFFWSAQATDANNDGSVSWRERYEYALAQGQVLTTPQFMPSIGFDDAGKAEFPDTVYQTDKAEDFEAKLASLKPGQYAVVTFSATWCGSCKQYRPIFEGFAKQAGGEYLFMRTENESLAAKYSAPYFPTVMVFDHTGKSYIVDSEHREQLFGEMVKFNVPFAERLAPVITGLRSGNIDDILAAYDSLSLLSRGISPEQASEISAILLDHLRMQNPDILARKNDVVGIIEGIYSAVVEKLSLEARQSLFDENIVRMKFGTEAERKTGFYYFVVAHAGFSKEQNQRTLPALQKYFADPAIGDFESGVALNFIEILVAGFDTAERNAIAAQLRAQFDDVRGGPFALAQYGRIADMLSDSEVEKAVTPLAEIAVDADYGFDGQHGSIEALSKILPRMDGGALSRNFEAFKTLLTSDDPDLVIETLHHFKGISDYLSPAEWEEIRETVVALQDHPEEDVRCGAYEFELDFVMNRDSGPDGNARLVVDLLRRMFEDRSESVCILAMDTAFEKLRQYAKEWQNGDPAFEDSGSLYVFYFEALPTYFQNACIQELIQTYTDEKASEETVARTLALLDAVEPGVKHD